MQSCLKRSKILLLGFVGLVFSCQTGISARPLSKAGAGQTFDRLGDYRIGNGDELFLKVHGDDSLSAAMVVQENGQIALPLGGFVNAYGLTLKEIRQRVETQLSNYMVKPRIVLTLGQRKSYKAYFAGEVVKIGPVQLEEKTTLLKGLTLVGGLTPYATKRIVIMRKDQTGKVERYFVEYDELLDGSGSNDSFLLERGDTILAE